METVLEILTTLSSIIGVPATLGLAWAIFVIRDHHKRIQKLEADLEEAAENFDTDLEATKTKLEDAITKLSEKFEQKINELNHDQKTEIGALYKSINTMAIDVATIKGILLGGESPSKMIPTSKA